jgi:diamine N-acetyltransferase
MTDQATPIYNIVGELVALGPLQRDLLPRYTAWINDLRAARFVAAIPRPFTAEQEADWYDNVAQAANTAVFTIYERATGRPIGTTSLNGIDQRNRTAEFGILLGEADARGRGYGTEVTRLMLDYAFTALGLHSVMLRVLAVNLAGLRAYQKAGFREIGRRRASQLLAGDWIDTIYMDCLASEFESPVLARVFVPDEPR